MEDGGQCVRMSFGLQTMLLWLVMSWAWTLNPLLLQLPLKSEWLLW